MTCGLCFGIKKENCDKKLVSKKPKNIIIVDKIKNDLKLKDAEDISDMHGRVFWKFKKMDFT